MKGAEALDGFLGNLAARDASDHTRRAYRTAVEQYLAWLDERDGDWRAPPRRLLRAYLAELQGRGLARIDGIEQRLHLIHVQHLGQPAGQARCRQ